MENILYTDKMFYVGDKENPDAYIKYENQGPDTIAVESTYVDEKLRGQGMAAKLTERLIAYSREEGLKVVPVCSYVVKYFEKHQEHQDILK